MDLHVIGVYDTWTWYPAGTVETLQAHVGIERHGRRGLMDK